MHEHQQQQQATSSSTSNTNTKTIDADIASNRITNDDPIMTTLNDNIDPPIVTTLNDINEPIRISNSQLSSNQNEENEWANLPRTCPRTD